MKSNTLLSIGNTVLFLGVITVNALANALPINGMTTGEISDLYPSLFTPAGVTFSIWSLIYLALLGFVIYQWTLRDKIYFPSLSRLFIGSCIINISWILAWHHLLPLLSVAIMILFLGVLIRIFLLVQELHFTNKEYLLVTFPFTIYLAWICVATIANIAAWLTSINLIDSLSAQRVITVVMMLVAAGLAAIVVLRFRDYAFPLVTIWALAGIAIKGLVVITPAAVIFAAGLLLLVGYLVVSRKRTLT